MTPFFQRYFGLINCIIVLKEFVSLTMVAMEMGKRHYFSYHSNSYKEEKIFHQKYESFTFELPLIKLSWPDKYHARKNVVTSKIYILRKKVQKQKPFLHFMTNFHNFSPKTEPSWVKWMVKPILETTNVYMYVCFTFSIIKYLFGASKISDFWRSTVSY